MRDEILQQLWEAQNEAYALMSEYDALPHRYGKVMLYQAEADMIDMIAAYPGITATDLANRLKKTVSACSQMIHKLRLKGLVDQVRNENNNRLYNLTLTEKGGEIYRARAGFEKECQANTFRLLNEFSEEDLAVHLAIQKRLNEAYKEDVRKSREQTE